MTSRLALADVSVALMLALAAMVGGTVAVAAGSAALALLALRVILGARAGTGLNPILLLLVAGLALAAGSSLVAADLPRWGARAANLVAGVNLASALLLASLLGRPVPVGRLTIAALGAVSLLTLISVDWPAGKLGLLDPIYGWLARLRLDQLTIHPNQAAASVGIFWLPAAAFTWAALRERQRVLAGAGAIACGIASCVLVLTVSRSAALGAAAALLVVLVVRAVSRDNAGWRRAVLAGLCVAILAGSAALVTLWLSVAGSSVDSTTGRLELWTTALLMVRDLPWTGVGLGDFNRVVFTYYTPQVISSQELVPHAHNLLLQAVLDFGITAALALFGAWLVLTIRLARQTSLAPSLGFLGGVVLLFVFGLGDAVSLASRGVLPVWLFFGLAAAWSYGSPAVVAVATLDDQVAHLRPAAARQDQPGDQAEQQPAEAGSQQRDHGRGADG